jgi:hypothetical protein
VFDPDDLEGYAAVRDRLRLHIVAWARRHGLDVEPSLVAAALDHKHGVDGRLGHWTRAHIADALAVWFPRTVALHEDEREAVPAALHALIGFLADQDWLGPRSAPPAELHAQITDSTPALHDALDDERNHDLGTFWAVQMLRHGVPTADPAAVAGFLHRVHTGELEVDRAALAEITRRQLADDPADPTGGPVGPHPALPTELPRCCCPGPPPCWPPRTPASRWPGCAPSPAGCAPGARSPATAACCSSTPGPSPTRWTSTTSPVTAPAPATTCRRSPC